MTDKTKPTCVLTVDGDEVNAAIIAEAAKQIGSTAMNVHNCDVTLRKGRKTESNPNPSTHFEVAFYPERGMVAETEEVAPVAEVKAETVATEEVAQETATAGGLFKK